MLVRILYGSQRGQVLEMPQLNAEHAIQTNFAEVYEAPADDVSRCAICGLPLAASAGEGCVRGNCSLRPAAMNLYAPARAVLESFAIGKAVKAAETANPEVPEQPERVDAKARYTIPDTPVVDGKDERAAQ